MKKKTIKSIAYACADSFKYKHKDESYRCKDYRATGDYWGDIPIDDKLTDVVISRLEDTMSGGNGWDIITAIYSFNGGCNIYDLWALFSSKGAIESQCYCEYLHEDTQEPYIGAFSTQDFAFHYSPVSVIDKTDPDLSDWEKGKLSDINWSLQFEGTKAPAGLILVDSTACLALFDVKRHQFDHPIMLTDKRYNLTGDIHTFWGADLRVILKRALKQPDILTPTEKVFVKRTLMCIESRVNCQQQRNKLIHNQAVEQFNTAINSIDRENGRVFFITIKE